MHNEIRGWSGWQIVAAVILALLGVLATFEAWRDILHIAVRDEESSHIFLVPLVVAWLVWVRRGRWRQCQPVGTLIGPLLVAIGWFLYSCGDLYPIQSFWHGGAVLIVAGCLLSLLGKDVLLHFLPAFVVLVFLVPVPGLVRQQIALPLQTATASVTHAILEVAGVEIWRSGNVLRINGTNVAIAEACNGLRMVFALALVSYAFAFGTPLRLYVRILVVAASPLSAILCNMIRLLPTVYLYGYRSGEVADWFHASSGWIMLPVAFLLLMGVIRGLRWALVPVTRYTLAYD